MQSIYYSVFIYIYYIVYYIHYIQYIYLYIVRRVLCILMSIYLCICICICISTGLSRVCLLEPLLQIDAENWRLEHWDIDAEEGTVPWYSVGLYYYYDPLCNPMGHFCGPLLYSKWLFITVGAASIDFLKRAY